VRDLNEGMALQERVRAGLFTGTHPAGGCEIGRVVDPDLSVYGLEGLTVADASVFPMHVTNNPNLTCHVVGEVAAARISGR
jgi:choline dehydrogenase